MRHPYLFIGLTPSERSLLESLFALDQGEDGLVPVGRREDAHLIVANGDDRAVVDGLRVSHPGALLVLVGRPPGAPTDLPVLRRPLEMGAVIDVLSRLDWPAGLPSTAPVDFGGTFGPSTVSPAGRAPDGVPAPVDPAAYAPTTLSMPLSAAAPGAAPSASAPPSVSARATWVSSEAAPLAPPSAAHPQRGADFGDAADADVLVVAGALGTRSHTLPRGLRRLGLRVRLVEGAQAVLADPMPPGAPFVFLDQASLGDDLLPLARALAAQRPHPEQPPHVVVVARRGSAFDRLRARRLGATWMTVPIERERLLAFFARRGLQPRR